MTLPFALALYALAPSPQVPEEPIELRFELTADRVLVFAGEDPFTTYRFDDDGKPSLYPLFAPGGVPVTRSWPLEEREGEARDHPHHRSLWFAHGSVNGHDFWHGQEARIEHLGQPELVATESGQAIRARLRWLAPDGELVCTEDRRMSFHAWRDRRAIDFELRLRAPGESPLAFGDTKEGTFALRLTAPLRLKGAVARGSALSSEGHRDGECWGKRARWMTYWGPVEGLVLGVAIFDHPRNHAHPTRWHARDYGLFAANPFGLHDFEGAPEEAGELVVPAGGEIVFRYRVLIYEGEARKERLDDWYGKYAPAEDG